MVLQYIQIQDGENHKQTSVVSSVRKFISVCFTSAKLLAQIFVVPLFFVHFCEIFRLFEEVVRGKMNKELSFCALHETKSTPKTFLYMNCGYQTELHLLCSSSNKAQL